MPSSPAFDAPVGGGGGGGDKAKAGHASGGGPGDGAGAKSTDAAKAAKRAKAGADVKWAEDFRGQADVKLKKAGIPDDQRKRITDHLATLTGAALAKEAHLLDHVLKSPNADRALGTHDKTLSMSKENARAGERLTPAVREELVRGVADRRTDTSKGLEGVLGQRQAEEARAGADQHAQGRIRPTAGLDESGRARAPTASPPKGRTHTPNALMLKAVAARGDRR